MISPAESNNIAAIKPTTGLVSQDGVIPVSRKHDSLGPMARTIKDAAAILTAIAGKDLHDPRTARIPFSHMPDYTESCKATDLYSVRIGVPWNTMADVPSAIMETFKTALAQLKSSGATIIDTEYTGADQHAALSTKEKLTSQLTNFRQSMDDFLQELERNPNEIYSVEDLSNVVMKDPREDYPNRDIELWKWAIDLDEDADAAKLASERDAYFAGEGGILGALERSNLDALVFPTAAKMSDHFAAGGGLPVITIPLGYLPNDTEVKWSPRHDLVTQSPNRP
jgi:amidase